MNINFRNKIETFYLSIDRVNRFTGKAMVKKESSILEKEKFLQILNITAHYLSDTESYSIILNDYIKKCKEVFSSADLIPGFFISPEKTLEEILTQLNLRRRVLEKRFIENDKDEQLERIKIRGEIDGINYSINTILKHSNKLN